MPNFIFTILVTQHFNRYYTVVIVSKLVLKVVSQIVRTARVSAN